MARHTPDHPRANRPRTGQRPASPPAPPVLSRGRRRTIRWVLVVVVSLFLIIVARTCMRPTAPAPEPPPVEKPRLVDCKAYPFKHFSKFLNDRLPDYNKLSRQAGIAPVADANALQARLAKDGGGLVRVESDATLVVAHMEHGHPYLTPNAHRTLRIIATEFQSRIAHTDLAGARLKVTNLLRTIRDQRDLGRSNVNATKDQDAPHTHGTSLDISYMRFMDTGGRTLELAGCQQVFLAETLAEVIVELRQRDKRLFATREKQQACYHLAVCR